MHGARFFVPLATLLLPARALACGASAGGAAGVSSCSLSEHLEAARAKWRLGATYGFTSTALRFNGDATFDQTRHVVLASVDGRITRTWTLVGGVGSIVGGRLQSGASSFDMRPGFLASFGAAWRVLDADGPRPFVVLAGQLAFVATTTKASDETSPSSVGYEALDARLSAAAGWPIGETLTPYALARAFGGPVFWEYRGTSQTGTDVHHFQIGGGLLVRVAKIADIFAEGVPLGEQSVSAGIGLTL